MRKLFMKKLLFLAALSTATIASAQKVQLKKDAVIIDGAHTLNFKRGIMGAGQIYLFSIADNKEQVAMFVNDNQTATFADDDFLQIKFIPLGLTAEIRHNHMPWKTQISMLAKNEIFTPAGELRTDKVELFIKNYHENITNRTIIIKNN